MTESLFSVSGYRTVITGGSSGIGAAIAERFVAAGADVAICSREQSAVDAVADRLTAETNSTVLPVKCDVRDTADVETLMETTTAEFGGIDVLVNNAGASFVAPLKELSENGWETILDINLSGVYRCTRAAGERMRGSGGGSIINIASIAGQNGAPEMSHYGAAKAGVINFTKTVAEEWAPDDVRVNAIAPGMIATEGAEQQIGLRADDIDTRTVDREVGTPEEIAAITQFLASPASSYVVGETLTASGTETDMIHID